MMKKFVAILAALMLATLAIVPLASASNTMYVCASNGLTVKIHTYPSTASGNVICNLGVGFPVNVLDVEDGWAEVSFKLNGKSYTGYMMADYIDYSDPSTRRQTFKNVSTYLTVTIRPSSANGRVNLWPSASKRGQEIRTFTPGEQVTVLAASNAWYKVQDMYGNIGYVAKAYVKKL